MPVEDLQRVRETHQHTEPPAVGHDNTPGGKTVRVPGGPVSPEEGETLKDLSDAMEDEGRSKRVASAFVKKALYWAAADRQYQASTEECESGIFICPKCKDAVLKKAIYKRQGGTSEHLLGCPVCLFLIKRSDIIGHPEFVEKMASAFSVVIDLDFNGSPREAIYYEGEFDEDNDIYNSPEEIVKDLADWIKEEGSRLRNSRGRVTMVKPKAHGLTIYVQAPEPQEGQEEDLMNQIEHDLVGRNGLFHDIDRQAFQYLLFGSSREKSPNMEMGIL
jgi:hypothetical protein